MAETPFIISGADRHARLMVNAAVLTENVPTWILDDNPSNYSMSGILILSSDNSRWLNLSQFRFTLAIDTNVLRCTVYQQILGRGERCSVMHPSAIISLRTAVGVGSVVKAEAADNFSAELGCNVVLNTACSVGHECYFVGHVHTCP
jgi:hypothetical protein